MNSHSELWNTMPSRPVPNHTELYWVEEKPPISYMGAVLGVGLTSLILIFGVCGNALLILSIIFSPQLRKVPNAFILHLAVLHLIYVLCSVSITLAVYVRRQWEFGFILLIVYHSFTICISILTVSNIIIVAYVRYFRLLKPDLYKSLMRPTSLIFLMIFKYIIVAAIAAILLKLKHGQRRDAKGRPFFSVKYMLSVDNQKDTFLIPIVLCSGIAVFVMLYVYANIHLVVHNGVRVSVPSFITDHRDMVLRKRKDLLKKELVYIKAIMVVFVFYILSLLQYHVIYEIDRRGKSAPVNLCIISVVISRMPYSITWLILGAVSPAFRNAYFSMMMLRCVRLRVRVLPHVTNHTSQPGGGAYPDINIVPPSVSQALDSHAEIVEYLAALTAMKRPTTARSGVTPQDDKSQQSSRPPSSRTVELNYLEELGRAVSEKGYVVTCERCHVQFVITTMTPQPSTSNDVNSHTECETCRNAVDTAAVHCQTNTPDKEEDSTSTLQGPPYPYTAWHSEDVSFESVV